MAKCPYTFPARSRKAMLEYLGEHESYWPMNSWNGGFVLSWNIKVYHADYSGKKYQSEYPTQDRFDKEWSAYLETQPELFGWCCEDAGRMYFEDEWTNYPGIEQGEWKFSQNGRSGGHMILTDCPSWAPAPQRWRVCSMSWHNRDDYQEWLAELDTETLKKFYRAIRVLDHDLRREAISAEISYQFAFRRNEWEQEQIQNEIEQAAELEESRPDMYA